jgi:arabinose-5-phosphate isomerase
MTKDYISQARAVIKVEKSALEQISAQLDTGFNAAVEAILACQGRVIVTGMGKSGHIARKIAATLASTGTPAFFVHPAEAAHGDLGMMVAQDVVLALSHSGESDEVVKLLPALKRKGVTLIAMSGRRGSSLAQAADIFLNAAVNQEACPLGLAPTSSTTAALALEMLWQWCCCKLVTLLPMILP